MCNFSSQTKTSSKKTQRKHNLTFPRPTVWQNYACRYAIVWLYIFCISYQLFSKSDEFYQNFQETEAIEQTAEEREREREREREMYFSDIVHTEG